MYRMDIAYYIQASNSMIDIDAHRRENERKKNLQAKVDKMGFGGSIRQSIADFVGESHAPKRKRNDAGDIRRDYVQGYVYEYTNAGDTLRISGPHRPNFVLERPRAFGHEQLVLPSLSEYKKKKRKHERDTGYRGY